MRTPDISIIIPAYNARDTITGCLDSIIRQDGIEDFEIIVVNDGSTDNTPDIIQEYIHNHKLNNMRLITQKNHGVSVARNTAIREAKGRFLSFVDADDMVGLSYNTILPYFDNADKNCLRLHSDKTCDNMRITFMYFHSGFDMATIQPVFDTQYFVNLINPMRADSTDISLGGKIMIDCDKCGLMRHIYETDQTYKSTPDDKTKILYHADIRESANFALYRRKFIERAKLNFLTGMHLDEDMLFTQQAVLRAQNVATVPNATYLYNRHPGTLSCLESSDLCTSSMYEKAMIQRHSMILSELGQIHRYRATYKNLLQKYVHEESVIQLYPDAKLPEYCTQCNRKDCVKCPMKTNIQSLLKHNIDKYCPKQR